MSKYFEIDGYWKDDKSEFSRYVVKEFDDVEEDEEMDNKIFFYGLSEVDIQRAIEDERNGEEDYMDFAITAYNEITVDQI
jgi:hypothetical protein